MFRALVLWMALASTAWAVPCKVPEGAQSFVASVVDQTNALRGKKRRSPLALSTQLSEAAQAHACFMAKSGKFSHTGAGGSDVGQRVSQTGYSWRFVAENIAQGQPFPGDVVRSWNGSTGHRRNMLHKRATEIGIGLAYRGSTPFWVMVLGTAR